MNKKWWLVGFGISAPLTLIATVFLLFLTIQVVPTNTPEVLAAATQILEPQTITAPVVINEIYGSDARSLILQKYLAKYKSPLEDYTQLMVQLADKYKIDFRLFAAIAQQESNLCKKAPENSFNCWGFGIHSGKVTYFDSYPQAMESVAKWLAKQAKVGRDTPEEVMIRYNPPSIESGTGAWAKGIRQFLADME